MKKRIYIGLGIGIVVFAIVDVVFPDHHHAHFPWHTIPAFDVAFGFLGCLLLGGLGLGLGNLFLWRPTCSVLIRESDDFEGARTGTMTAYKVEIGDAVKEGQILASIEMESGTTTVSAPMAGKVQKIFYASGDTVRVGETILDLAVNKEILNHSDSHETHKGRAADA
jgi:Biotin-requiring enzyme